MARLWQSEGFGELFLRYGMGAWRQATDVTGQKLCGMRAPKAEGAMAKVEKVGRVIAYAAARLVPHEGATLTAEAITLDYHRWCDRHGYLKLRDGAFREEFARLAAHIEMRSEANDARCTGMWRLRIAELRSAGEPATIAATGFSAAA